MRQNLTTLLCRLDEISDTLFLIFLIWQCRYDDKSFDFIAKNWLKV